MRTPQLQQHGLKSKAITKITSLRVQQDARLYEKSLISCFYRLCIQKG